MTNLSKIIGNELDRKGSLSEKFTDMLVDQLTFAVKVISKGGAVCTASHQKSGFVVNVYGEYHSNLEDKVKLLATSIFVDNLIVIAKSLR